MHNLDRPARLLFIGVILPVIAVVADHLALHYWGYNVLPVCPVESRMCSR